MVFLTYNISAGLKNNLQIIEKLRRKILLSPLPREIDTRLKWEAKLERVHGSLVLTGSNLSSEVVSRLMMEGTKIKLTPQERDVLRLKNALDYIDQQWSVSPEEVTIETIYRLQQMITGGKMMKVEGKHKVLGETLSYVQRATENPVVGAGVVSLKLMELEPFVVGTGRTSRALVYLFLSKYGYDFRKMLVFEKLWVEQRARLKRAVGVTLRENNLTPWLEFLSESFVESLREAAGKVVEPTYSTALPDKYWSLNSRQKQILTDLEVPTARITNKDVQRRYKISQITASRDLAKLANLGLLFVHGKGRSVYYTKA